MHDSYAQIEWAGEGDLPDMPEEFRAAFVKPSENATVWRERPYELFLEGRWESGQFDRVVFDGEGGDRKAVIYDFKTNAVRRGESDEEFAVRMRRTYSNQMASYRRALSALTGIDQGNVETVLLVAHPYTAQGKNGIIRL